MRYSQFASNIKGKLYGAAVLDEQLYLGERIAHLANGAILVNDVSVNLNSIEEAKTYIRRIKLEEDIVQSLYEDIPSAEIASIIREHHDVKVTNNLIETYLSVASSKTFSIDPAVRDIRSLNALSSIIENKIDYILEDDSKIAISIETLEKLSSILEDKYQLVEYMRISTENFMHILREIS